MKLQLDVVYQLQDMMRERITHVLEHQEELFAHQVFMHPIQVMGVDVVCYSANDGRGACHYVGVATSTDRSEEAGDNGTYTLYFCITPDDKQPPSDQPWGYRWSMSPTFGSEEASDQVTRVRDMILNFLITGNVPVDSHKLQKKDPQHVLDDLHPQRSAQRRLRHSDRHARCPARR